MRLTAVVLVLLGATSPAGRSAEQQFESSVLVHAVCGLFATPATGTVLDPHHVLTAGHAVAPCKDGTAPQMQVDDGRGHWLSATVEKLWDKRDAARLFVGASDLAPWAHPLLLGPRPGVGDRVCMAAAWPRYEYRCGLVQPRQPEDNGKIRFEFLVEHGNSGSALYDQSGALVGVVVEYRDCEGGVVCGGAAESIAGLE